MAEIADNKAFDYMQEADPDKYITGGAMEHSEYEMDMSPEEQEEFLRLNTHFFNKLYETDPLVDKEKLSFKSYLENLDPELIKMRADDIDQQPVGEDGQPGPHFVVSKGIDRLSRKHYGDIDRLRNMVLGGK